MEAYFYLQTILGTYLVLFLFLSSKNDGFYWVERRKQDFSVFIFMQALDLRKNPTH